MFLEMIRRLAGYRVKQPRLALERDEADSDLLLPRLSHERVEQGLESNAIGRPLYVNEYPHDRISSSSDM